MSVVLLLIAVSGSLGCGFTTHDTVAHRAFTYFWHSHYPEFEAIVDKYQDAIQGGAPFPDYLYACGPDHDAGERAHWPPFQAAAADVIRSRPKPWDEDTQKLIAFMFGVVSHYIADVSWHGLWWAPQQGGYGLIEALGAQDFNCTGDLCSVAHTAADTGGEFVDAYTTKLRWMEPGKWIVPVKDLIEVFAHPLVNKTVKAESIMECHAIFLAGELAVKELAELLYEEETSKAPFLQEHYLSWPAGGLDDMAVWTARMVQRMEKWIMEGPPSPIPPSGGELGVGFDHEQLRLAAEVDRAVHTHLARALAKAHVAKGTRPARLRQLGDIVASYVKALRGKVADAVVETRAVASLSSLSHTLLQLADKGDAVAPMETLSTGIVTGTSLEPTVLSSQLPLEYQGQSLATADLDGDGKQDLIMGAYGSTPGPSAPQQGAVYIQWAGEGAWNQTVLRGPEVYGRFGWAMATLDFNHDGIDDLAVSAPAAGMDWDPESIEAAPDFRYWGAVHVYFGRKGQRSIGPDPSITIRTSEYMMHLGHTLQAGDIDGDGFSDLLVGCPLSRGNVSAESWQSANQRGALRIFLSNPKRTSGTELDAEEADVVMRGATNWEWFGYQASVVMQGGTRLLLVGAPGCREWGITVGRLYAFSANEVAQGGEMPLFTITGAEEKAKLGFSFAFGYPQSLATRSLLALAAPSANNGILQTNAGSVYLLSIENMTTTAGGLDYRLPSPAVVTYAELRSGVAGARFGWTLGFEDLDHDGLDDLIVAAPLHTFAKGGIVGSGPHQAGAVHVWKGGATFPHTVVHGAENRSDWSVVAQGEFGRFGTSLATLPALPGDAQSRIAIGAPRDAFQTDQEMPGSVYVYTFPL